MRFCFGEGRFVDAYGALPDIGFEAVGDPLYPDLGCSRLRCSRCGQAVRDAVGLMPLGALPLDQARALHGALDAGRGVDAATLAAFRDDGSARFYVCGCGGQYVSVRGRYLSASASGGVEDLTGPTPDGWACAGHDDPPAPGVIDGEALPPGDDAAWDALAHGALRGERARARPDYLADPPHAWCRRMLWLLAGSAEGDALGAALGRLVILRDAGALALYHDAPLAAGAEAVESLAAADPASLAARVVGGETEADVVQLVLAQRLLRLAPGPARAATFAAGLRAADWPSRRRLVLIEALAACDLPAVLDDLPRFGDERRVVRQLLLGASAAGGVAGVEALVTRMKAEERPGLAHVTSLAQANLPAPLAARVATIVGG